MPKANTDSFITELPLLPTPGQVRKLLVRFDVARQVFNACLGESLKRLDLLRQSRLYQRARKLPKGKERSEAFKAARSAVGFREYDIHHWATQFTHSWINDHLDARTVERVATTAFDAAEKCAFGIRGRPRMKRRGDLTAIDGKINSGCRWRNPNIVWKGLTIAAQIDTDDAVIQHGLSHRVKFVRLVHRVIHGHDRFFAQLVCEGEPYCKPQHEPAKGAVGLDLGPSTIAAVGNDGAFLAPFCESLIRRDRQIRVMRRALDRRRRANNPDNYNADGTIRRGPKRWVASTRQHRLETRLHDIQRRQADHRKNEHGQLVHRVLTLGNTVRMESLSYKSFQSQFGKSVGFRAPGIFVARLRNAIRKYKGELNEFPTRTTKLSQFCHGCGRLFKKSLSQRWHQCDCGVSAQRDLYSAFLARFVQGETLDAVQAQQAWRGACTLLDAAYSAVSQQVMDGRCPSSFGARSRPSRNLSRRNFASVSAKAVDVVPLPGSRESRGEADNEQRHTLIGCARPPNNV